MKRHQLAYQKRMGLVGTLQSCICTWPLEREATSSEHSEFCPAHRMLVAAAAQWPFLAALFLPNRGAAT